jgi:hypothetical protein
MLDSATSIIDSILRLFAQVNIVECVLVYMPWCTYDKIIIYEFLIYYYIIKYNTP